MSEPEKFGSYLVYELLGTGGMATVHLAESQSAGGFRKRVALKRLLPNLAADAETVESFTREAKLASHLHHTNIAQTYDLGRIDGAYYIAMELVGGPTLRQLMKQCAAAAGAIPIEHAVCILAQTCEALDYAHSLADDTGKPLGIVHRDVSPANIIISGSGVVKLIDFGLAKISRGPGTQAGILKGKLGYMAPEYTLGRLDARADLFALGVVAHELLTGKRLFESNNELELIRLLREMPIQPPSRYEPRVSHALDDIVMTALQRDPAQRWQSAQAMHAALVNAARELGFGLAPQALATWIGWAFEQKPREEASALLRVIDTLGDPSETSIETAPTTVAQIDSSPVIAPPPPAPSAPSAPAPSAPAPPLARPLRAPPRDEPNVLLPTAPQQARWPFRLILVLLLVAAGALAAFHYGLFDSLLLRFRK